MRTPEGVAEIADEIDAKIGLKQLKAIHLNDSRDERGSNRDRHAPIGKGEIGRKGSAPSSASPGFGRRARRPRGPGDRRPWRRPQGRAARPSAAPRGAEGTVVTDEPAAVEGHWLQRIGLLAGSALASINIWTGAPLLAVWVGSQIQAAQDRLSMTALFAVVATLAVTVFALAWLLA